MCTLETYLRCFGMFDPIFGNNCKSGGDYPKSSNYGLMILLNAKIPTLDLVFSITSIPLKNGRKPLLDNFLSDIGQKS